VTPSRLYGWLKSHKIAASVPRIVHETAAELRSTGFISKRRMREYDELCLEPIRRRDIILESVRFGAPHRILAALKAHDNYS